MSNNPTATLTRPQIQFCLARQVMQTDDGPVQAVCTRLTSHRQHCCDEILGVAFNARSGTKPVLCRNGHDHSEEKGLRR